MPAPRNAMARHLATALMSGRLDIPSQEGERGEQARYRLRAPGAVARMDPSEGTRERDIIRSFVNAVGWNIPDFVKAVNAYLDSPDAVDQGDGSEPAGFEPFLHDERAKTMAADSRSGMAPIVGQLLGAVVPYGVGRAMRGAGEASMGRTFAGLGAAGMGYGALAGYADPLEDAGWANSNDGRVGNALRAAGTTGLPMALGMGRGRSRY